MSKKQQERDRRPSAASRRRRQVECVGDRTVTFGRYLTGEVPLDPRVRLPGRKELRRAIEAVPERMDWDWARDRLVPVFERPGFEPIPSDPRLLTVVPPAVTIGFGIDLGPALAKVSERLCDQWECSLEQIQAVAFENLRRPTGTLDGKAVERANFGGHLIRVMRLPDGCSSSILLVQDELMRIFGDQDQVFTAPARSLLLSFPMTTPARVVGEITVDLEEMDPHPLLMDPFVLQEGTLVWEGTIVEEQMLD